MKINDLLGALPIGKKEGKSEKVKALTTVWGEMLDPGNVWQEYPRPRLVRGGKSASNICIRVYEPTKDYHAEDRPQGLPVLEIETDKLSLSLKIPDAKLWNPDTPWIYPVEIEFGDDLVQSYFAVRRFTTGADKASVTRLLLNGEPVFMNGVLDQGYWPDGLYTAPSDGALIYDITRMKALGFNMLRKHAKIENPRYYYHCDRLGMIVWQDMVNGGGDYPAMLLTYIPTGICVPGPRKKKPGAAKKSSKIIKKLEYGVTGRKSIAGRREFIKECESTVKLLRGHPSVAAWVIFNEGWGQFDTPELTEYIKELDPGRFVDSASGWFESKAGDIKSVHNYFRKQSVPLDVRAKVISEYGGLVLRVDGHSMHESTYGYHTCKNAGEFRRDFRRLMDEEILPLEAEGLCGAVYTQVSDIEEETNGLLTYDRKVCKIVLANTSHI